MQLDQLKRREFIALLSGATRVFPHVGVEMQGGFGQSQGMSLDQGKAGKQVQASLEQLKADIESGG